jgi:hypothetical protein
MLPTLFLPLSDLSSHLLLLFMPTLVPLWQYLSLFGLFFPNVGPPCQPLSHLPADVSPNIFWRICSPVRLNRSKQYLSIASQSELVLVRNIKFAWKLKHSINESSDKIQNRLNKIWNSNFFYLRLKFGCWGNNYFITLIPGADAINKFTPSLGIPYLGV